MASIRMAMSFLSLNCFRIGCENPRVTKQRTNCLAKAGRAVLIRLSIAHFFLNLVLLRRASDARMTGAISDNARECFRW
jgi:hypothetical protein